MNPRNFYSNTLDGTNAIFFDVNLMCGLNLISFCVAWKRSKIAGNFLLDGNDKAGMYYSGNKNGKNSYT